MLTTPIHLFTDSILAISSISYSSKQLTLCFADYCSIEEVLQMQLSSANPPSGVAQARVDHRESLLMNG